MDIVRIIQEAATWIEKVNPDYEVNLYRSEELKPDRHFYNADATNMPALVDNLVLRRSALLQKMGIELIPVNELHLLGRIALFDAYESFWDGAPEVESDSYVDLYDTPPHDTWIGVGGQLNDIGFYDTWRFLAEKVLLAWVPQSKYYCVQGAIDVACLDNFEWGTNVNINQEYKILANIFAKPQDIIKSKPDANILISRQRRLDAYTKELDRFSELATENKIPLESTPSNTLNKPGKTEFAGQIPNTSNITTDGICVYATFKRRTALSGKILVSIAMALFVPVIILSISEGIIALLFFTLIIEAFIARYALWNFFGKETLVINTKTITWQHDYGFFVTKEQVKLVNRRLIIERRPEDTIKSEQQFKVSFISYDDNDLPVYIHEIAVALTESDADELEEAIEQLYIDRLSDDYEMPYINLN